MAEPTVLAPLVHEAVARHAALRPDAPALMARDTVVDYATLQAAAEAYATELFRVGVRRGDIIPLILPRSPQLVAVQLGLLRLGAAYACLDVRWPAARIAALLEWMAPRLAITVEGSAGPWPPSVLTLPSEEPKAAAGRSGVMSSPPMAATEPATVFFTSGTTGTPKGVVVPHRAVTRLFQPGALEGFGPGEATPQAAPPAWDMYAFEVWGQLTTGGAIVLVEEDHLLPGTLRDLVRKAGVSTLWITTALFNLFVEEDPDCFTGLGRVYAGGEKHSVRHVADFLHHHPALPLFNGYGPVEGCMLTTTRRLVPEDCAIPGGVPVGEPVPGTEVVLLDAAGAPCPDGEPGEIWITGLGLAAGYLLDEPQTRERFKHIAAGRAYRTGDLGVRDRRGTLHFRGRVDRQVKVSGHRVEPEEVEAAGRALDGVRDCAVVPVYAPDSTVTGLALFYVPLDPGVPDEGDPLGIRGQLLRTLPAHLVPATVGALRSFPVTANGKMDRAALTARVTTRPRRPPRSAG